MYPPGDKPSFNNSVLFSRQVHVNRRRVPFSANDKKMCFDCSLVFEHLLKSISKTLVMRLLQWNAVLWWYPRSSQLSSSDALGKLFATRNR